MERGESKKPPGSGTARKRAAKNGRTCPTVLHLFEFITYTFYIVEIAIMHKLQGNILCNVPIIKPVANFV